MPTETVRIPVLTTAYTLVADGAFNVFVRPTTPVGMRLVVGQSLPAPGTANYLFLNSAGLSLSDLEGSDRVYVMAEAAGAEVVVIRST